MTQLDLFTSQPAKSEDSEDRRGRGGRIGRWTTCSAQELWTRWRALFEADDDAIMTAIWMGNRLVKSHVKPTRRKFYSIKDAAIKRYGTGEAQRVREEKSECWACQGMGIDPYTPDEPCERCGGTGSHRSWWLYVYAFTVAGQRYCFHSYVEPATLLDGEGGNAEQFGSRFTDQELADLALPMTGLLKLLSYVAAGLWGMQMDNGRYV